MSKPAILYLLCGEAEYEYNAVHAAYTSQADAERDAALLGTGFHVLHVPLDPDTSPLRNGQCVFNGLAMVRGQQYARLNNKLIEL